MKQLHHLQREEERKRTAADIHARHLVIRTLIVEESK